MKRHYREALEEFFRDFFLQESDNPESFKGPRISIFNTDPDGNPTTFDVGPEINDINSVGGSDQEEASSSGSSSSIASRIWLVGTLGSPPTSPGGGFENPFNAESGVPFDLSVLDGSYQLVGLSMYPRVYTPPGLDNNIEVIKNGSTVGAYSSTATNGVGDFTVYDITPVTFTPSDTMNIASQDYNSGTQPITVQAEFIAV